MAVIYSNTGNARPNFHPGIGRNRRGNLLQNHKWAEVQISLPTPYIRNVTDNLSSTLYKQLVAVVCVAKCGCIFILEM